MVYKSANNNRVYRINMSTPPVFDPAKYKENTREHWQAAAKAWNAWGVFLRQWLGPATELMLDIAGVVPGSKVLDVAAGAGDQTLQIAQAVGPKGHVLATDISSNILEFAKANAHRAGFNNVETKVLDGENLELPEDSYDAVVCRLGLMLFPNPEKALASMHRVVKKGGKIGLIVFTVAENNQFFAIPISTIRRRAKLFQAPAGQPGPFSLGSPGILNNILRRAGFTDISIKRVSAPLRMNSAEECVRFEQESFGVLHQMMSGLNDEEKAKVWQEIRRQLGQFETGSGFVGPCELLVVAAAKPGY